MGHGKYSGLGIWVRSLIHRIEKMKAAIDLLTFVKEDLKKSAITKYDDYFQRLRSFIHSTPFKDWKEENKELEDSENGNPIDLRLNKAVLQKIEENEVVSHPFLL